MFDKFNFFEIQKESVDKQMSNMAVTTLISLAGIAVLVVVDALFLSADEDDEEQKNSDE